MTEPEKKVHEYLKNKGFTTGEAFLISDAIRKDLPLDEFADKKYNYGQMRVLKDALENKKPINKIKNHKLSASHMQTLLDLQDKIDIDDLLDPALSIAQLECCGQAKIQGISYDIFIKYPNFAMIPNALELHKLYGLDDYSWVKDGMSEKSFTCLADLVSWGEDVSDISMLSEYEISQEWSRIRDARIDEERFSAKNLKKYKLFKNLNL